jgi:Leucine-rich repeat (LRR) protein
MFKAIKRIASHIRLSSTNAELEILGRRLQLDPRDVSIRKAYLKLCNRLTEDPEIYINWVSETYGFYLHLDAFNLGGAVDDLQWMAGLTFPNLEVLAYDYANLTSIEGLGDAITPNLIEIDFSNNKLTDIDDLSTLDLSKVIRINLEKNKISKIPQMDAPVLRNLLLNHNNISHISELSHITAPNLKNIHLVLNKIYDLDGIEDLNFPKLKNLFLNGNPLSNAPYIVNQLNKLAEGRTKGLDVYLLGLDPNLANQIYKSKKHKNLTIIT